MCSWDHLSYGIILYYLLSCCHDEPVRHCLYGGQMSRRDEEFHQTLRPATWQRSFSTLPQCIAGTHLSFIDPITMKGWVDLSTMSERLTQNCYGTISPVPTVQSSQPTEQVCVNDLPRATTWRRIDYLLHQTVTKSNEALYDNEHLQLHLSKAKCKPLTKKLKLIDQLFKADSNDVTLHCNLLQQ